MGPFSLDIFHQQDIKQLEIGLQLSSRKSTETVWSPVRIPSPCNWTYAKPVSILRENNIVPTLWGLLN